uniref:Uncharacterized protein n=1 Tax=Neolamprologus brichardi TaxID=32507 RepID=A0A3Q4HRT6_NEOBR
MSVLCYNRSCGKRFDPDNNPDGKNVKQPTKLYLRILCFSFTWLVYLYFKLHGINSKWKCTLPQCSPDNFIVGIAVIITLTPFFSAGQQLGIVSGCSRRKYFCTKLTR